MPPTIMKKKSAGTKTDECWPDYNTANIFPIWHATLVFRWPQRDVIDRVSRLFFFLIHKNRRQILGGERESWVMKIEYRMV